MVQALIVRSWWVWAFALLCFAVVESLGSLQSGVEGRLRDEIAETKGAIAREQHRSIALQEQLGSGEDPAWVERQQREQLGVARKGETKVYFTPRCAS
jgi:cell division protein FtsB